MRRLPAEWEEQEALLIAYPHEKSDWAPYLEEAKAFFDQFIAIVHHYQNVQLITVPTNDTWVRDYGPITVFEDGEKKLLDFTFNGWGLKFPANLDNQVNRRLFGTRKIGFVLEGGSIESNGQGVLLTTTSCLLEANRNPHMTQEQIESYLKEIFGLKKVIWLQNGYLEGDDTDGHIDMLARFVAPDTIAYVTCDDKNDPHYEPLKKMEAELQKTGFKLVPLPWVAPKYFDGERLPASYANFVIINKAVIVPTYGDPNDDEACAVLKRCFPTRDIIALEASVLIRQHGSIHCSCMNLYRG